MTDPIATLLARVGKTRADAAPQSKLGKIFRRRGVEDTPELQRILHLPSYRWQDDPELPALCDALTDWLALPPRTCPETCVCRGVGSMGFRLTQAAALQAIHDVGGMLGPIRVGGGKTLISFAAGVVLESERTLLLLPAKLIEKTEREFALLRRHWRAPTDLRIMSYELLSRDRGLAELLEWRPDLLIADEGHKLKNPEAACTKRVRRYLTKVNPEARYVDMSGTVTKRSILEYWHRLNWAVPDGFQALPRHWPDVQAWADAIDADVNPLKRMLPGALLQFCSDDDLLEIGKDPKKSTMTKVVRQAYGRRLLTSPGVVGTEDQFDGAMSLIIQGRTFDVSETTVAAFQGLRDTWERPDGYPIDSAAALWSAARQLSQGFHYYFDPEPPKDWLDARREWAATVREVLRRYRDLDSPLMVARAADSGRIPWALPPLERWRVIKGTFVPNRVVNWIDDSCLQWVASEVGKTPTIIWVHEVVFGQRLSRETGIPYYGAKGRCGTKLIDDETKTCIASTAANCEGRNLQYAFARNIWVTCPAGGDLCEQVIGRTHRDGQMADEVTVELPLICYEQWDAFRKARRDAEYTERTMAQTQKLNFADVIVPEEKTVAEWHKAGDPLWCKDNAEFFDKE